MIHNDPQGSGVAPATDAPTPRTLPDPHCTQCGSTDLEPGFIDENATVGYTRWTEGPLELGSLGNAKRKGRARFAIHAFRCTACGHLELFVPK